MNFEPRIILGTGLGNNADARVISVRAMNDAAPSPAQLSMLAREFDQHLVRTRLGLPGFTQSNGVLADGSAYRIVSNSGMHTIMVWPVAGFDSASGLADWFRAVPATDTWRSGQGSKPSWGWHFPDKVSALDAWPDKHKQISALADHPGHVTWSNPNLKVQGKPIVLSWRGPRDRYAATIGHNGPAGGGITAHERNPDQFPDNLVTLPLAEELLTDGPYVWINGHKVNTGVPKVIAACLHEYDHVGDPGQFVLRVCADRTIESTPRMMVVYDLVPTADASGAPLKEFAEASAALNVKASYLASEFSKDANNMPNASTPGIWDYWQRPHFNRSGTRLATLICKVGANGTDREAHAVSFDFANNWTYDDDVTAVITSTETHDFGSIPWTASATTEQNFFIACDFDGDSFIYVELVSHEEIARSAINQGALVTNFYAGTADWSINRVYTIQHSSLGILKQWTTTVAQHGFYRAVGHPGDSSLQDVTGDYTLDITNGWVAEVTRVRDQIHPEIAFIGDLSKRTFAVGYPEQNVGSYSAEGHLSTTKAVGASYPLIPVTATLVRPYLVFDVYFDGVKVAEATSGGYDKDTPIISSNSYNEFLSLADVAQTIYGTTPGTNTNARMARYKVSSSGPPSFEGRINTGVFVRAADYDWGAAPMHHHCATHPEKWAAYIGASYYASNSLYGGITPRPHGLEIFILNPGSPITQNPEPYIGAGAHPTLSVPVFMGLASISGETT